MKKNHEQIEAMLTKLHYKFDKQCCIDSCQNVLIYVCNIELQGMQHFKSTSLKAQPLINIAKKYILSRRVEF